MRVSKAVTETALLLKRHTPRFYASIRNNAPRRLRQTPSAIRDDRFTRCPFPAATTDAPVAPVRSSNTAMEHQNCCTDLRHPELLAACCPYSSVHGKLVVQHLSRTKKVGKLPPLRSFSFLTLREQANIREDL